MSAGGVTVGSWLTFLPRICAGARFDRADLSGAQFFASDLSDARFQGADMTRVTMRGVELVDVDIDGEIMNVTINGVDVGPAG